MKAPHLGEAMPLHAAREPPRDWTRKSSRPTAERLAADFARAPPSRSSIRRSSAALRRRSSCVESHRLPISSTSLASV